jgi:putative hydrolase of HD superfamily
MSEEQEIHVGGEAALEQILNFIVVVDKAKNVMRQSRLFDNGRPENDAEHSWTVALMAILLKDYAGFPVKLERAVPMLLIHDIVEVDAGDTFLYAAERAGAHDREAKAADHLFALLPSEQCAYFRGLWDEYEAQETNEAQFAEVFDRLEPLMQNYLTQGCTWKKYGVRYSQVIEKSNFIKDVSPKIWDFMLKMLDDAIKKGYLEK